MQIKGFVDLADMTSFRKDERFKKETVFYIKVGDREMELRAPNSKEVEGWVSSSSSSNAVGRGHVFHLTAHVRCLYTCCNPCHVLTPENVLSTSNATFDARTHSTLHHHRNLLSVLS
jgi:hypothetical protein